MSRKLPFPVVVFLSLGLLSGIPFSTPAQETQPQADQSQRRRPSAEPLRVESVSPELERVLKNWEQASSRIERLQGKHRRFVYDDVFNVEKRADGVFYYEAPDKGRIDISPSKPGKDEVSRRTDPKTGKPFKLEADRPERWLCTGADVRQINDADKTVEIFPIPEQSQGQNIMEGPLPFLFGMPAEKAKLRFQLKLLKETDDQVWLAAKPRWKQDAANYREAKVILEKPRYLPTAVQLKDPSGNLETVYAFSDVEVNKKDGLLRIPFVGGGDPFNPPLRGYKTVVTRSPPQTPGDADQATDPQAAPRPEAPSDGGVPVPSLVGLGYKEAEKLLSRLGLEVRYKRGRPADEEELVFVVYEQQPQQKAVVPKGQPVTLTLYDKMERRTSSNE